MSWVNVSLGGALAAVRADSTSVTLRYGTTPPRHVRRRPRPELAVAIALADLGLASLPSPIDVLVAFDLVARRLQLLSLRLVQKRRNAVAPLFKLLHGVPRDVNPVLPHQVGHRVVIPPLNGYAEARHWL